jgi:hypothetical protein
VLATGEGPQEEGDLLVPELGVGAEPAGGIATADLDRLEAGRLGVFEDDVLVVVLGVDLELDLDEVAALDFAQVGEFDAIVLVDLLIEGLAEGALGEVGGVLALDELVVLAADLDFETGGGDVVFEGEVGEVGVVVERAKG